MSFLRKIISAHSFDDLAKLLHLLTADANHNLPGVFFLSLSLDFFCHFSTIICIHVCCLILFVNSPNTLHGDEFLVIIFQRFISETNLIYHSSFVICQRVHWEMENEKKRCVERRARERSDKRKCNNLNSQRHFTQLTSA